MIFKRMFFIRAFLEQRISSIWDYTSKHAGIQARISAAAELGDGTIYFRFSVKFSLTGLGKDVTMALAPVKGYYLACINVRLNKRKTAKTVAGTAIFQGG
ncbi:MAG: hypothetical protein J5854_06420 [Clostridia bacterium]|nr:hypothetical protein [Clostridia bacterium]